MRCARTQMRKAEDPEAGDARPPPASEAQQRAAWEVRLHAALQLALHAASGWTAGAPLARQNDGRRPLLGEDAAGAIPQVHGTVSHPAAHVSRDAGEGLGNPMACLRGCLEEEEPVPLGEGGALLCRDRAVAQVALVRDERNRHAVTVAGRELARGALGLDILQPSEHVLECVAPGGVVDQKGTRRPSVVGARHGAEALLPGGVPHLQLDHDPVDDHAAGGKLHADSGGKGSKAAVDEVREQRRLPNSRVTNQEEFEEVRVVHGRTIMLRRRVQILCSEGLSSQTDLVMAMTTPVNWHCQNIA